MTAFSLAALLSSGVFAGFVHVVSGPDHLAAIEPYAVHAKSRAWRTGIRWGFGHSAGVIGVGVVALLVRDVLSIDLISTWGQCCVGVMLIAIGIWGLRAAFAAPSKTGSCKEAHSHAHGDPAFAVGTVHGLAGSSHLLGIVPALALPSDFAAATYLLLFGLGSIFAMGAFSALIGWIGDRTGTSGVKTQSLLLAGFSAIAIVIGGVWLFSNT